MPQTPINVIEGYIKLKREKAQFTIIFRLQIRPVLAAPNIVLILGEWLG